jgi:hypothetical protein
MISLYTESFPKQARHSFAKELMGKFSSAVSLAALMVSCALLPSCGGGSPTKVAPEVLPTAVSINPSGPLSLQLGQTQAFSATPAADSFTYQSSNPAVLTVANNGQACAGTWNSLSAPQVCTPGQPGVAQVTASTLGVASSPVTIYVHAPITSVSISKVAGQPSTISDTCVSKGPPTGPESWTFQANAFNGTTDITSSVGPFSWQQINPGSTNIVTLSTPPNGTQSCVLGPNQQCLNQQTVTASVPGVSQIYASASGFSSQPVSVETCRVAAISVAALGDVPTDTLFQVNNGSSTTLNATAIDSVGQKLAGIGGITWSSSNPIAVTTSGSSPATSQYASVGTVTAGSAGGAATVIASCTPPACNAGIKPSLPIYPQAALSFNVHNTSPTVASPAVYATTTGCADPLVNPSGAACTPGMVPITQASSTAQFAAGTPVALPSSPNSLIYDVRGANAYLGVDSGNFGQQGLMIFSSSTPTKVTSAPGKVLAVSPDQSSVIVSDTVDTPNQVFICSPCAGSSPPVTALPITGATAAAFSPDSYKAYIIAGSTLYVYSKVDPLATFSLGGSANDVAFHPEGGFAFLAGPGAAITSYRNCDTLQMPSLPLANTPVMIRALPDGSSFLALDPPNIDIINVALTPSGLCNSTAAATDTPFNLGQGSFTPNQFLVSDDGRTAYILGNLESTVSITGATQSGPTTTYAYTLAAGAPLQTGEGIVVAGMQNPADNGGFNITRLQSGTFTVSNPFGANSLPASNGATGTVTFHFPFIMVFNVATQTLSTLSLANGATPLSASVAPAGNLLFVGADDGTVHVIDTASGLDMQQVTFPYPTSELCLGPGTPSTQVPLSQLTVLSTVQNGSSTTYSYRLISGPVLKLGQNVTITNMSNGGNNGTYTIAALGTDGSGNPTFTVSNPNGVTASGQSGVGTVPISCNPDMVVVKP